MNKNILLIISTILLLCGCKKDMDVWTARVNIGDINVSTTQSSARITGSYKYVAKMKSVYVVVSKAQSMTNSSNYTATVSSDKSYSANINYLDEGTTYYFYCVFDTGYGTAKSGIKQFVTDGAVKPTVTTKSVSSITQTTASCGGNVTSDGNATVTARGVCWSTSQYPTISDSYTTNGSGTGSFTSSITGLSSNTTYYVRAYATNKKGTGYGEQRSFTTSEEGGGGSYGGHEYVDLGLPSGTLWATCNVGANSPSVNGNYYAWGETTTNTSNDWSTYKWCNGSERTLTKYNTSTGYGTVDNKTVLEFADDAARANWGGDWRMPTAADWQELSNKCTWTWIDQGWTRGYTVTGTNGNSIFLPAADGYGSTSVFHRGLYWSSSLYTYHPSCAYNMCFYSDEVYPQDNSYRCNGFSVRPVR